MNFSKEAASVGGPEIGWYLNGRADHLGRDASHHGGPPRGMNVS
jgi:hypothetical protein